MDPIPKIIKPITFRDNTFRCKYITSMHLTRINLIINVNITRNMINKKNRKLAFLKMLMNKLNQYENNISVMFNKFRDMLDNNNDCLETQEFADIMYIKLYNYNKNMNDKINKLKIEL